MVFSHSTHTTNRALTYSYIHIQPQLPNTRYLLFLHGFPSTSYHWHHQISFFKAKGYGVIAPDLLGFGETSKPTELEMYKGEDMANDIVEILISECVEKLVGVAHDWGCFLLSRLANYHPDRFSGYVYIDHGYMPPGRSLTTAVVQHINRSVEAKLGFSILGYFLLFDDDDAPGLLDQHSESVESLYFSTDEQITKKYKGALGGLRSWLTDGKTTKLPAYLTSEDHKHYEHAFSKEKGGYRPAINWYRAGLRNINEEDEQKITTAAHILTHPTLLIASTNVITAAMNIPEQMCPFVPDLTVEQITGGHWLQLEKPDEVNEILDKFVEKVGN
ncbi:related to epoxide hydrolase [Fusarium fujikuroi IMI 58289]|uniref:Related to epoxide hydrolase n=1 Tax=Gibberella fujikuroi (strain CBS 195.34 / IMI 58289 / NRRL A-6831) TaxID=1279085 RepID=S0EJ19_GIBF5|nr:related to epoxide hydrolase [Fusarium fujikuroi IMI 58289]CCT74996.1 related to epoxide hydrolase [Fusarium fujikuroi IMI 58289]SCO03944.1 related to epoxide hydrolase [Fusarium fujikuroi]